MTRRPRRASSAPQRVGSDEGLTSSRPRLGDSRHADRGSEPAADVPAEGENPPGEVDARRRPPATEVSRDDTDEGWGERGDGVASARWLRENRPPHWG